jgi:dsRNA-specific ribonuclease
VEKKIQKAKVPLNLSGKHPTSALMELSHRKGWPEPNFKFKNEETPFLYSVVVNGTTYTPTESSSTKKVAKADCAKHALISIGIWPKED